MDYSCRATAGHEALVALRICHALRAQIQRATPSRRKTHYRKPSPQGRSCSHPTVATALCHLQPQGDPRRHASPRNGMRTPRLAAPAGHIAAPPADLAPGAAIDRGRRGRYGWRGHLRAARWRRRACGRGAGEVDRTLRVHHDHAPTPRPTQLPPSPPCHKPHVSAHNASPYASAARPRPGSPRTHPARRTLRLHARAPTYRAPRSYPRHRHATGHTYRRTTHRHTPRPHDYAPTYHSHTRHDARCGCMSGGGSACCACHAQQRRLMDYSCRATAGHEALVALRICHAPRAQIQRATPSRRKTHYRKPSPQGRSCGRSTEATGPFAPATCSHRALRAAMHRRATACAHRSLLLRQATALRHLPTWRLVQPPDRGRRGAVAQMQVWMARSPPCGARHGASSRRR